MPYNVEVISYKLVTTLEILMKHLQGPQKTCRYSPIGLKKITITMNREEYLQSKLKCLGRNKDYHKN